jgi:outer membrane murein-binding lipoprotein Lpp
MTFVQKYLFAPALGAAGVFAGYVVYRRKFQTQASVSETLKPAGSGSSADLQQLATVVGQLTARVAAVEEKDIPHDWLESLNAKLASLDHRVTSQNDRIGAIESSYGNIEARLDAILKSLDRRENEPAVFAAA